MLFPLEDKTDDSILINCPECHRTIWANTICYHGYPPPPRTTDSVDKETMDALSRGRYKARTRDLRKPKPKLP